MQKYRTSEQRWIFNNSETAWIYEKIVNAAFEANKKMYKFDLHNMREGIQHTTFYDRYKGHYDCHVANNGKGVLPQRKLSGIILLTDPSEFEGGDLEVNPIGHAFKIEMTKGKAVFFPSWWLHRVRPVTKGTRKTLVLWLGGGHFR